MRWLGDPSEIRAVTLKAAADQAPNVFHAEAAPIEFDILKAEGGQPAKIKGFSMLAYTGGPMRPSNWPYREPIIVDLEGMAIPRQAVPVDLEHGTVIGHTEAIEKTAQRVKASGVLSALDDNPKSPMALAASETARMAVNGFPWQSSMTFEVSRLERVDQGQTVKVNGRNFDGPVYVARASGLHRISFTDHGADSNTNATIAAKAKTGEVTMNEQLKLWLQAKGIDAATVSPAMVPIFQAQHDAEIKPNPAPAPTPTPAVIDPQDAIKAQRQAYAVEAERVGTIRKICASFGNPAIEIEEGGKKQNVNLEAHAVANGWDWKETKLHAMEASSPRPAPMGIVRGTTEGQSAQVFEAAMCIQLGMPESRLGKWFDQQTLNAAMGGDVRNIGLSEMSHIVIARAGGHARPGKMTDDSIRASIGAERTLKASGFSTLSLSGILSNLANKAMLNAYQSQNVIWPLFCAIRNHNDFKVHTHYRLDSKGSFKKVGPNGELKHVNAVDASYTNQLGTYGAIIALTRQMWINDDLSAFAQLPAFLGRMSAIRPEEAFHVLLLSNPSSFFSSGNGNIVTGTGGAMTAANGLTALTTAESKFSNQVDSNGKPIGTLPDRMLLGTANFIYARNIYEGRVKITGKDQTEVANNEHAGKYTPYRSPYVNNTAITDQDGAAITGQSSTLWWLFADPAVRAAVAMAFLNGQQVPTIQSADTEFETLGMQWRAFHDFGVGMEDPVAATQINGA